MKRLPQLEDKGFIPKKVKLPKLKKLWKRQTLDDGRTMDCVDWSLISIEDWQTLCLCNKEEVVYSVIYDKYNIKSSQFMQLDVSKISTL